VIVSHQSVPPPSSLRHPCVLRVSALSFSSAFSSTAVASHQIPTAPVFSFTYELPIFYLLSFDIHTCNGGVGTPPSTTLFARSLRSLPKECFTIPLQSNGSALFLKTAGVCTPLFPFCRLPGSANLSVGVSRRAPAPNSEKRFPVRYPLVRAKVSRNWRTSSKVRCPPQHPGGYSCRRAAMGSMRLALRAGIQQASVATPKRIAGTPRKTGRLITPLVIA